MDLESFAGQAVPVQCRCAPSDSLSAGAPHTGQTEGITKRTAPAGLFSFTTLFQLITLPVEFNASARAVATLEDSGLLEEEELGGVRKVLSAAALTYVASLLMSMLQLLRYVMIFVGRGGGRRGGRR